MSAIGSMRGVRGRLAARRGLRSRFACARVCLVILGAMVAAFAACASPRKPEPLATPALSLSVRHFAGASLRGPIASAAAIDAVPERALLVRCRFVYLDHVRTDDLDSVLQHAKLVVADTGNQVLLTRSGRDPRVFVASGERAVQFADDIAAGSFGRNVPAGEIAQALPEDVTLAISTREKGESDATPPAATSAAATSFAKERGERAAAIFLSRGTGSSASAITVLVALEDLDSAGARDALIPNSGAAGPSIDPALNSAIDPAIAASAQASARRRGVLLDEAPIVGGAPLVLVMLPSDARPNVASLALIVEAVQPAQADAELAAAVERCAHDVALESDGAARRSVVYSNEEAALCEMNCGVQALEIAAHHRPALAYLASTRAAPLCESLAYVADERTLAQYVTSLLRASDGALAPDATLGWRLEVSAYRFLARLSLTDEFPPELASLLARRAGEAGRYPDELEDAVDACGDLAALEARFAAENRRALGDDRPASRLRAYDWLAERGLAPPEYDPLAPESERRAALAKAALAKTATSNVAPAKGPEKP